MAQYELLIETNGTELEVTLVAEHPQGDAAQGTQKQRRGHTPAGGESRNERIKNAKATRRREGYHHVDLVGPHLPIIVRELPGPAQDTVVWKCAKPFIIDVEIDEGYTKVTAGPNPPRSPFKNANGENFSVKPQISQTNPEFPGNPLGGDFHVVIGTVVKGTQAFDHMFYKATIWSDGLKLDPDYYCDR